MNVGNRIPLIALPRQLLSRFGASVPYRKLYLAAVDGKIPAVRDDESGRWSIDQNHLDQVAHVFGLGPIVAGPPAVQSSVGEAAA